MIAIDVMTNDNPPLSPQKLAGMKRVPPVRTLRRALQLTQEEHSTD
jgi:hypothetical protein